MSGMCIQLSFILLIYIIFTREVYGSNSIQTPPEYESPIFDNRGRKADTNYLFDRLRKDNKGYLFSRLRRGKLDNHKDNNNEIERVLERFMHNRLRKDDSEFMFNRLRKAEAKLGPSDGGYMFDRLKKDETSGSEAFMFDRLKKEMLERLTRNGFMFNRMRKSEYKKEENQDDNLDAVATNDYVLYRQ